MARDNTETRPLQQHTNTRTSAGMCVQKLDPKCKRRASTFNRANGVAVGVAGHVCVETDSYNG